MEKETNRKKILNDIFLKLLIILTALFILIVAGRINLISKTGILRGIETPLWKIFGWAGILMGVSVLFSYIYKTILWLIYKPLTLTEDELKNLPSVSVIIPAYNEGEMVRKTIESVIKVDYPSHLLKIICVDDGSKDDTYKHILNSASEAPDRITALRLPQNRGKRHALYTGFKKADSDIVITLDSDTVVPPFAIKNIIVPFLRDEKTGAVAGKIKVFNRRENLLTRMLWVRYILGFDFSRAYQSVLKTVFCCPGAFTAYRLNVIKPHLDVWLNQKFLGNRCTNGDDHSLTNFVLKSGYNTLYQSNAEVYTVVPHTYKKLCKMYIRWARSNIRESLIYITFSFKRLFSSGGVKGLMAFIDSYIHFIAIPLRFYLMFFSYYLLFFHFAFIIRALASATIVSFIYTFYYLRSERNTDVVYGFLYAYFSMLSLQWIYPYAGVTLRNNKWMTRNLPQKSLKHRRNYFNYLFSIFR